MYRLSTTLIGHEDDVKSLAFLDDDSIVSASRDSTVRIWNRINHNSKDFDQSIINFKSSKFVNSLAIYRYNNENLIVSAGSDNIISLTSPDAIYPNFNDNDNEEFCLIGHTSNICSLDTLHNLIISGSWDSTAKVWDKNTGEILYDLKGHEHSVWSAKFLDSNTFITCSADRTIKKWVKNKQVKSFIAHDDVVRDIIVLPNGDFASCSNDLTIKIWDSETFQNKAILTGHQSFIYSLSLLSNGDIVSCGEDRSVRIWRDYQCIQIITLPCVSVWKTIALNNDDIAIASSDKTIRIFTKDASRFATEKEQSLFLRELEESSIDKTLYNDVNKNDVQSVDSLNNESATLEGETKLVKNKSGTLELYQWTNSQWIKIGQIASSSEDRPKQFYNGGFYDYIFDIDIEDGKPPLKLPVNLTDDPYEVSEKFLEKNNLPGEYLQQMVQFLLTNAEGIGAKSEIATTTTSSNNTTTKTTSNILPQTKYLSFEKLDLNKLINAFKKLSFKQPEDKQLDVDLETLFNCENYSKIQESAMEMISYWDDNSKLLAFDILRAIITKIKPNENLFPVIRTGLESNISKIQMMTIRILINTFSAKQWGEPMMLDADILDIIFTELLYENLNKDSTFLPITVSTLILNYSVLVNKFSVNAIYHKLLKIIKKVLSISNILNDDESLYRLIVAIGTLNHYKKIDNLSEYLSAFATKNSERFELIKKDI